MHIYRKTYALMIVLLPLAMTGCASMDTPERKAFVSCLNEAERIEDKYYPYRAPTRGHSAPAIPAEVKAAKNLCWQMKEVQESTVAPASLKKAKTNLALQCTETLKNYRSNHPSDKRHISAMSEICSKMIGATVELK
jgi:hypothetical protein